MSRRARRLFQEVLKVFRNLCPTLFGDNVFKTSACNLRDERNAIFVSEDLADKAGRVSFFGQFQNKGFYLFRLVLEPGRGTPANGSCRT